MGSLLFPNFGLPSAIVPVGGGNSSSSEHGLFVFVNKGHERPQAAHPNQEGLHPEGSDEH